MEIWTRHPPRNGAMIAEYEHIPRAQKQIWVPPALMMHSFGKIKQDNKVGLDLKSTWEIQPSGYPQRGLGAYL